MNATSDNNERLWKHTLNSQFDTVDRKLGCKCQSVHCRLGALIACKWRGQPSETEGPLETSTAVIFPQIRIHVAMNNKVQLGDLRQACTGQELIIKGLPSGSLAGGPGEVPR